MTRHALLAAHHHKEFRKTKTPSMARHTVLATHDDFVDELPIGHVYPVVEKCLLFHIPVQLEHAPYQLVEQLAIRQTVGAHDSRQTGKASNQPLESGGQQGTRARPLRTRAKNGKTENFGIRLEVICG